MTHLLRVQLGRPRDEDGTVRNDPQFLEVFAFFVREKEHLAALQIHSRLLKCFFGKLFGIFFPVRMKNM